MKKKAKVRKPRNLVVLATLKRSGGAGCHEKTGKAIRRREKVALSRVCNSVGRVAGFYPVSVGSIPSAPTIFKEHSIRVPFDDGESSSGLRQRLLKPPCVGSNPTSSAKFQRVGSSIGRASVSKTEGWGFKSLSSLQSR